MTLATRYSPPHAPITPDQARSELLSAVFEIFDKLHVSYCLIQGYQDLPDRITCDVEMMVARSQLVSARRALLRLGSAGRLVQWFDDGACWAVVAARGEGLRPAMVRLHLSPTFELEGQVFYRADRILAGRRRHRGFWISSSETEFACICICRMVSSLFADADVAHLAALYDEDATACEREIHRFFDAPTAGLLLRAARSARSTLVSTPARCEPNAPLALNTIKLRLGRFLAEWSRRAARWTRPRNGLHVVFLGPDGVGKRTVMAALGDALSPGFLRTQYKSFAPSLVPGPLRPQKQTPHALPARSIWASFVKALWWFLCYTAGYFTSIRPGAARANLILHHPSLSDVIVDPKRYRYAGPEFLLKSIWRIAPRPDVIFLLDAPTDIIQSRQRHVSPEETDRQRVEYRRLMSGVSNVQRIDTNRPLDEIIAEATEILLDLMAIRTDRAASRESP